MILSHAGGSHAHSKSGSAAAPQYAPAGKKGQDSDAWGGDNGRNGYGYENGNGYDARARIDDDNAYDGLQQGGGWAKGDTVPLVQRGVDRRYEQRPLVQQQEEEEAEYRDGRAPRSWQQQQQQPSRRQQLMQQGGESERLTANGNGGYGNGARGAAAASLPSWHDTTHDYSVPLFPPRGRRTSLERRLLTGRPLHTFILL